MNDSTIAWSEEDTNLVLRRWQEGASAAIIGAEVGRSRNAVIGRIHRVGAKRDKPPSVVVKRGQRFRNEEQAVRARLMKKAKQPRKSPQKPVESVQPVQADLVPFARLEPNHCRWPIGDPRSPDFGFCGQPKTLGSSYCGWHRRQSCSIASVSMGGKMFFGRAGVAA